MKTAALHTQIRTYLEVEGKEEPLYEHSHAKGCLQHMRHFLGHLPSRISSNLAGRAFDHRQVSKCIVANRLHGQVLSLRNDGTTAGSHA